MREIKFRIWDIDRKVMLGSQYVIFYDGDFYENFRDFEDGILIENIAVMQSTGLKDKNGVEIYEGDIVAIENHPFQKTDDSDVGMEINGNYEVDWNADDLTWCAGSLLLARVKSYVRVIGDIHENPDLLEESK